MSRDDPILLICDPWKKGFHGNFGAILNFPDIPNKGKF